MTNTKPMTSTKPIIREVKQLVKGMAASDGDGVQLTRIIGSPALNSLDPFLLLDAFGSDKPQEYIGGFPPHPHRGFETVSYMLAGKMRHKDSAGNEGVIEAGGVQWMTAGSGIVHSEMPEQEDGLLSGFQLWVNLPAAHKMTQPKYQENTASEISTSVLESGTEIKVIAGKTRDGVEGVINNDFVTPTYWDVKQSADSILVEDMQLGHNGFIYVIEGEVSVGQNKSTVVMGELAVFTNGDEIKIHSTGKSRYLVIAGQPLNEPIARGGPFVMNTREEINQAFADYQNGRLVMM